MPKIIEFVTFRIMIKRQSLCKVFVILMLSWGAIDMMAADQFVLFQPSSDALQLKNLTVGFGDNEHSCVQIAAQNLLSDFEKVTGKKATKSTNEVEVLIGTVGVNTQIDQWVKQGLLRDLKGKTEKYIIKTIGNQLVVAGSDKRGTVYGIYELSKQIGVSPWCYWADVPVDKHTYYILRRVSIQMANQLFAIVDCSLTMRLLVLPLG